jgi:hypothetical protein
MEFSLPLLLGSSAGCAVFFIGSAFAAMSMTKVTPFAFRIARLCIVAAAVVPIITVSHAATHFQMPSWVRVVITTIGLAAIGLPAWALFKLVNENEKAHNETLAPNFITFDPRVEHHEAINKFEISIGYRNTGERDPLAVKKVFWVTDYSLTRDSTTRPIESGVDPQQDRQGFAGVKFSISKLPINPQFIVLIISYLKSPRDQRRYTQQFYYKWSGILRNGAYNSVLENITMEERAKIEQKMAGESRCFS